MTWSTNKSRGHYRTCLRLCTGPCCLCKSCHCPDLMQNASVWLDGVRTEKSSRQTVTNIKMQPTLCVSSQMLCGLCDMYVLVSQRGKERLCFVPRRCGPSWREMGAGCSVTMNLKLRPRRNPGKQHIQYTITVGKTTETLLLQYLFRKEQLPLYSWPKSS